MEIYYRDNYEINLLSAEEYEKYRDRIPHINCWWWLQSPGCSSDRAATVHSDGSVLYDGYFVDRSNGAVYPALKISDYRKYEIGKRVVLYSFPWIIIDEGLAIAEVPIAFHKFDAKSNDYENSEIKKFLNDWFERR